MKFPGESIYFAPAKINCPAAVRRDGYFIAEAIASKSGVSPVIVPYPLRA